MDNGKVTDLDIQALIDGELDAQRGHYVLTAIQQDPALFNRYTLYQKQKNLLKNWWKDN